MSYDPGESFTVTFRDTEHFYLLVGWLNANVGRGRSNWYITKRVLRNLQYGPYTCRVTITSPDCNIGETALFLKML